LLGAGITTLALELLQQALALDASLVLALGLRRTPGLVPARIDGQQQRESEHPHDRPPSRHLAQGTPSLVQRASGVDHPSRPQWRLTRSR
jgi:hypothetical protein